MEVFSVQPFLVSFGRAPKKEEQPLLERDINEAKKFLGIENQAMILHGSCFPVSDKDLFIGSPINEKANEVNKFFKMFGFDSIQLGPTGLLPEGENSPYSASSSSENYLFSDMERLTKADYGKILTENDIKNATDSEYIRTSDMTDFEKARESYELLFKKAYTNFIGDKSSVSDSLRKDFENFKLEKAEGLNSDAIYTILTNKFNSSDVSDWPKDYANLNLYKQDVKSPKHDFALKKLDEIMETNKEKIELYKFKQFIIEKQEKEFLKNNPSKLKYIADSPIGFSHQAVFAHPEAFLSDFRIGCPMGGKGMPLWGSERGNNQFWNIPVLNPKRIFKEDGSLDIGGKLLYEKMSKLFDKYENMRIDHVLGLVDPWIYKRDTIEIKRDGNGNITYSGAVGGNLSKLGKENAFNVDGCNERQDVIRKINYEIANIKQLDEKGNYPKILEKIILPVIKEKGLKPEDLVWEALGTQTETFMKIYNDKLHLPNITNITWDRGQYQNKNNFFLVTSHDDDTFTHIATSDFFNEKKNSSMNPDYLIGWLYPEKNETEKAGLKNCLSWDTQFRVKTVFQELFRCAKKFEISFSDFFGLTKRYNESGTANPNNWKLRLTNDYKAKYFEALEKHDWKSSPINIPEMLERAVISKAYTDEGVKSDAERQKLISKALEIAKKMSHWKDILYEKSSNIIKKESISIGDDVLSSVKHKFIA